MVIGYVPLAFQPFASLKQGAFTVTRHTIKFNSILNMDASKLGYSPFLRT